MNIAVLGSGMMGVGIAQVLAASEGVKVVIHARNPERKPLEQIAANMDQLIASGLATAELKELVLRNTSRVSELEDAVKDADFIMESVYEDMELKQNLFAEVEKYCKPDAVFATNTSVMSVTEIGSKLKDKSRLVGAHFWNPAHLIPLVEVVKTEYSKDSAADMAMDLLKKSGKRPVLCKKDVPGFIANRIQHAVWREAFSMIEHGIADAKTVDEAIRFGPGLRWPILGPVENADLVGLDMALSIHKYIFPHLEDTHVPSPLLVELNEKGELGFKTGGKGYQEWTPEQMTETRTRLNEYLIDAMKRMNKENQK